MMKGKQTARFRLGPTARWLALWASASLLVGCEAVHPWQREALTHRQMRASPQPERAMARGHYIAVREAAQGGQGGAGGGCGCD